MDEKDKIIADLRKQIAKLNKQLVKQNKLISDLNLRIAKLEKDSSTSSKPPSSDIVKPPKAPPLPNGQKRKRGGQPNHKRHQRVPFTPQEIDVVIDIKLSEEEKVCSCGGVLEPIDVPPRIFQQVELSEREIQIRQYQMSAWRCPHCHKVHYAPLPPATKKAGLFGPQLQAVVIYMKGQGHLSINNILAFFRDIYHLPVSAGHLYKILKRGSASLEVPYKEVADALTREAVVHADETGFHTNGERRWVWVFSSVLFTVFVLSESRGSKVITDTFGSQYNGTLCCDFWSAYRKYFKSGTKVQFCWAHLIRDIKFLTTLGDPLTVAYGEQLLDISRQIFHEVHRRTKSNEQEVSWNLRLLEIRMLEAATYNVPENNSCQNVANRFISFGDCYFRFITDSTIPPTNNHAERQIRPVAIERYITHGCGTQTGEHFVERLWTVLATCRQQGRDVLHFLKESLTAYIIGTRYPSLLPTK